MTKKAKVASEQTFAKLYNGLERIGNKLPHPFIFFFLLWFILVALSVIFEGASGVSPSTGETVTVVNLINGENIASVLKNCVSTYTSFAPLGITMVIMFGMGITTKSGLMEEAMKKLVAVPEKFMVFAIIFFGICGNVASSAALAVIPALSAYIFFKRKRNPLFGLCVGLSGVSAGYTANIMITADDIVMASLSTTAAQQVDPNYVVQPTANYYYVIASVVITAAVCSFVVNKFLMNTLGKWDSRFETSRAAREINEMATMEYSSDVIKKALNVVAVFSVIYWAMLLAMWIVPGGPLRALEEKTLVPSIFLDGLVVFLTVYFAAIGLIYGRIVGTIKTVPEMFNGIVEGLYSVVPFMITSFPIANAVAAFNRSKIATVASIHLTELLENSGLNGVPLFLIVILVILICNLFMPSTSAKWAIMAPVLVPALMYMGYTPELSQLLLRIGDGATNPLSPFHNFMALHLSNLQRYDEKSGMGTLFANIVPMCLVFLLTWTVLLVWYKIIYCQEDNNVQNRN